MFGSYANLSKPTALTSYAIAILGGAWLGLASCGGHAWLQSVIWYALLALALSLLIFPIRSLRTTAWRLPACIGLFIVAHLVRAMVAPFHLRPDSLSSYLSSVWLAIANGPC